MRAYNFTKGQQRALETEMVNNGIVALPSGKYQFDLNAPCFKETIRTYEKKRRENSVMTRPRILAEGMWYGRLQDALDAKQAWLNSDGSVSWYELQQSHETGGGAEYAIESDKNYNKKSDKASLKACIDKLNGDLELPSASDHKPLAITNAASTGTGSLGSGAKPDMNKLNEALVASKTLITMTEKLLANAQTKSLSDNGVAAVASGMDHAQYIYIIHVHIHIHI